MRALLTTLLGTIAIIGCSSNKKDEQKHADVSAELRSTGVGTLIVNNGTSLDDAPNTVTATIESYKVPIGTINLVVSDGGSGYTSSSPNFYTCPAATDKECAVDLTNASALENLLSGSSVTNVEVDDSIVTYNAISVSHCHEHSSDTASGTFSIWVKAHFTQGSTTYYTNATTKLSTTGPAEEIEIQSSSGTCGSKSILSVPVALGPDSKINLVLYADPTLAVYGAKGTSPSGTESCVTDGTMKLCADFVSIFGTIDTAAPTVERYELAISGYASVIMTMLFDSTDTVFGASGRPYQTEALTKPAFGDTSYGVSKASDGTYTFVTGPVDKGTNLITGFKREAHSGTATAFGETFAYDATPL